jgi:hypothetical protein
MARMGNQLTRIDQCTNGDVFILSTNTVMLLKTFKREQKLHMLRNHRNETCALDPDHWAMGVVQSKFKELSCREDVMVSRSKRSTFQFNVQVQYENHAEPTTNLVNVFALGPTQALEFDPFPRAIRP